MPREAPHLALLCAGAGQCPREARRRSPLPPLAHLDALFLFPPSAVRFSAPALRVVKARAAQACGRLGDTIRQGTDRWPVWQKNPAGAPKAREAEHGRGMGGSARGGRGRRGGQVARAGDGHSAAAAPENVSRLLPVRRPNGGASASRGSRVRREAGDGVAARMSLSSVLLLQMVSDAEVGFASYLQLCYNWYQMQGDPSVSAENHIAKVDSLTRMIFSALVS